LAKYRRNVSRSPGSRFRAFMVAGSGTFVLAVLVSLVSAFFLYRISSLLVAFLILTVIVLIGVFFDIVGTASTAAHEPPFHAMAAERVAGASEAVYLIRNADRVANFCNDVVGDVCGTISGAIGATVAWRLLVYWPRWDEMAVSVVMAGLIAALTVGGKAAGKNFALGHANDIIFAVGRLIACLEKLTGRKLVLSRERRKARRKGSGVS